MTVSIGIAAYNAEKNIKKILMSLLRQKETGFSIKEIVVHSDCSSDGTVAAAKSINNDLINVIDNTQRKGFAGSVMALLNTLTGDVVVLLNDDITIEDEMFLSKLVQVFADEPAVGMSCGAIQALPPVSFIDKAIQSTQRAYQRMREEINGGHNLFTVDGKVMALSSAFREKLVFPANLKQVGNVDAFVYLSCIQNGFKYRYAKNALVYFRNPVNFNDYVKWTARNDSTPKMMKQLFGGLADKEYTLPKNSMLYYACIEFLKNPVGCLFIAVSRYYIQRKASKLSKNFNSTWETVQSSKHLSE